METTKQRRQIGRAKNAVLALLASRLAVPRIYLDATWNDMPVDILAIDRDGVGDVHVVVVFARASNFDIVYEARRSIELIERLNRVPAQFKYVAAVDPTDFCILPPFQLSAEVKENSFAPDGLGRIGFLSVIAPEESEAKAELILKPERFRATIASLADEYVQHHAADWEIRA